MKPKFINVTHIGQNNWFDYKNELIFAISNSLERLGFDVSVTANHLKQNAVNLIIGADILIKDEASLQNTCSLAAAGKLEIALFDPEVIVDSSLNGRTDWNRSGLLNLARHSTICGSLFHSTNRFYNSNGIRSSFIRWRPNTGIFWYNPYNLYTAIKKNRIAFTGLVKQRRVDTLSELSRIENLEIALTSVEDPYTMRFQAERSSSSILALDWGQRTSPINPSRAFSALINGKHFFHDHALDQEGYGAHGYSILDKDVISNLLEIMSSPPQSYSKEWLENEIKLFDQEILRWMAPFV